MDEALVSWADSVVARRRWCGALWASTLAMGIGAFLVRAGPLMLLAWCVGVALSLLTAFGVKLSSDEQSIQRGPYRLIAGALLVVSLAGCVLGLVPDASEISQFFAVFFATVACLAYRALRSRGPRAAVVAVFITLWSWLPFAVLPLMGCRRPGAFIRVPHWTETASYAAMPVSLFLVVALATAALFAFRPRTDAVPEARVV
jgi:hypothetical protein